MAVEVAARAVVAGGGPGVGMAGGDYLVAIRTGRPRSEPIEARIDLHGRTQDEAHAMLLRFLRKAQDQGAKFALVITGKGARARDEWSERGVLKRQVPLWLKLPEFRVYVVGFEPAHVGHGGEGALYVRIKKPGDRRRRTDS